MFGYMTEIDKVDILEKHEIEAKGEDIQSLLFHLLDEFLFLFSADPFFIARVKEFNCLSNFNVNFSVNVLLESEDYILRSTKFHNSSYWIWGSLQP